VLQAVDESFVPVGAGGELGVVGELEGFFFYFGFVGGGASGFSLTVPLG